MKIRFTTIITNSNKGFLLIDVLLAAAVISCFALPVMTGLLNSVAAANYARDVYKATLYAGNMLCDLETALKLDYEVDLAFSGRDGIFENFDMDYETDVFNYMMRISKYEQNGSITGIVMTTDIDVGKRVRTASIRGIPSRLYSERFDTSEPPYIDGMEINDIGSMLGVEPYVRKERQMYILLAEVFDKRGRSLICRAKPVFV